MTDAQAKLVSSLLYKAAFYPIMLLIFDALYAVMGLDFGVYEFELATAGYLVGAIYDMGKRLYREGNRERG